jgi:hypothetical protein
MGGNSVIVQKYINPASVEEWIGNPVKKHKNGSLIWKATISAFPLIGRWLVWKVVNGHNVRVQEYPWVGCGEGYRLPENVLLTLRGRGIFYLYLVANPILTSIWS